MLQHLATLGLAICGVLVLLAGHHVWRDRLVDNAVIISGLLLELTLVVLTVVGIPSSADMPDSTARATLIAYLCTTLIAPPLTLFLAIKERSRWAMGLVLAGSIVVAVLLARILQIWSLHV